MGAPFATTSPQFLSFTHGGGTIRQVLLGGCSRGQILQTGIQKDVVLGNPLVPSLRILRSGYWPFLWRLSEGTHTLSLDLKMAVATASRLPYVIVKANTELGTEESTTYATATTEWQTLGPISISPSAKGAVEVIIVVPFAGPGSQVNVDNFKAT
jgi:hypothetical protein